MRARGMVGPLRRAGAMMAPQAQSNIVSEGFKGGTRGAPIMPRDAVARTANFVTVGMNGLRNQFQLLQ